MSGLRRHGLAVYLTIVSVVGIAALGVLLLHDAHSILARPRIVALLGSLVVAGELLPIRVQRGDDEDELSVSTTFALALLILTGLGSTLAVQAVASIASDALRRRPVSRALFNVAQYSLALAAAGAALAAFDLHPMADGRLGANDVLPILGASVAFFVVNNTLPALAQALHQRRRVWGYLFDDVAFQLTTAGALLGMVPLVIAEVHNSLAFVPLVLLPLGAVYKSAASQAKTAYETLHDGLTGLPNRVAFTTRLHELLHNAGARQHQSAVMLIDLDRFKEVNDTLGHAAGDQLLQAVGTRLRGLVRPGDLVARLGGDEYGILLPDMSADQVTDLATRVLDALEQPFPFDEASIDSDASLGIALVPAHGTEVEDVLRHADAALYEAKRAHAGYKIYDPASDPAAHSRLNLLRELKHALAANQFVVHYQPKANTITGRVTGVEALTRWQHPIHGLLMPDAFIPLLEQSGLSRQFTLFVIRAALDQQDEWAELGYDLNIAVNVTVRNVHDRLFPADVAALVKGRPKRAGAVQLEITESIVMADAPRVAAVLAGLRSEGISLSLDDFGTGYSSLSHLALLSIDEIKIDKSFVIGMAENLAYAAIVRSTIDLAHNLGLRCVAEGVEDEQTWQLLADLGCDVVQGYHLSRPKPGDELTTWLQRLVRRGGHGVRNRPTSVESATLRIVKDDETASTA